MTAAPAGEHPAPAPTVLILSRHEIAGLMDADAWLQAVETGFRAAADGRASAPPPMAIEGDGGTFHAKGARLRLDRLYVALKLNGNFPDNPALRALPTIQGALLLCDGETGALLAILDSIEITLRRTAAATALAARFLARPDSRSLFICGCGAQGRAHLDALGAVLPLERVFAWDADPGRAAAFERDMARPGLHVETAADLIPARTCDIIVTCTTARAPFLGRESVGAGTFVAAVGADSPHKSEIRPELMMEALVVADLLDQCAAMGDLRHALAAGMTRAQVHADLGALVAGRKSRRTSDAQITLFDSTGTALQDVAAAASIYQRARASGSHRTVALGDL